MRSLSLGSTSKAMVILLATLVFPRIAFTIAWAISTIGAGALGAREQASRTPFKTGVAYYDINSPRPDTPYKWESRFNRAYALQSMGDAASEQAERAYQALVGEANDSYVRRSLLQLSELSFKRGDYGLSDSLANQVLVLFPEAEGLDNAHMRRALALQSLERYEDSTNEFLQVAEDSPHYASSRLGAGHQLLEQGQYDRPSACWTRACTVRMPSRPRVFYI